MNKGQNLLYELRHGVPTDVVISQGLGVDLMTAHDIRKLYEGHAREARSRGFKPIPRLIDYIRLLTQDKEMIMDADPVYTANELVRRWKKIQRIERKLLGTTPAAKQYA